MLGENKNLKDSTTSNINIAVKDNAMTITYPKTNKLITALFMVTDIMDKEEPLRNKLRFLGTAVISDIHGNVSDSDKKISEILSFLDICKAVGMISEMNSNILQKEFTELQQSVKEYTSRNNPMWLEEFMNVTTPPRVEISIPEIDHTNLTKNPIGHFPQTRIGVQKGGTLMKVLSDRVSSISSAKHSHVSVSPHHSMNQNYDILKGKRRDEIVSIIKNKLSVFPTSGGATITDIKNSAEGALVSCGEKTLQRELVSMVHDGVLKKTGEKRWSKYFL